MLLIAVGVFGIIQVKSIQKTLHIVTDQAGPIIETTDDLIAQSWKANKVAQEALGDEDIAKVNELKDELNTIEILFQKNVKNLSKLIDKKTEIKMYKELQETKKNYKNFNDNVSLMFNKHLEELENNKRVVELMNNFSNVFNEAHSGLTKFAKANIIYAEDATKFNVLVASSAQTARKYIYERDISSLPTIREEFTNITEQFEKYKSRVANGEGGEEIIKLVSSLEKYVLDENGVFDAYAKLLTAKSQASEAMEKAEEFGDKINKSLEMISGMSDKISKGADEMAKGVVDFTTNGIMVLLSVAIIIAIFSMVLILKAVIKPLNTFQEGLLNFFKYLNKEVTTVELLSNNSDDEIGRMSKVVNKSITKTKLLMDQDSELIEDVKRVVALVKEGKIKQEVTKSTSNESLEELKTIFNEMLDVMSSHVSEDLNTIQEALESYQQLDFTHRIENQTGRTAHGLNSLADIINDMLIENKSNGLILDRSSDILLENVAILNNNSIQSASSLH